MSNTVLAKSDRKVMRNWSVNKNKGHPRRKRSPKFMVLVRAVRTADKRVKKKRQQLAALELKLSALHAKMADADTQRVIAHINLSAYRNRAKTDEI